MFGPTPRISFCSKPGEQQRIGAQRSAPSIRSWGAMMLATTSRTLKNPFHELSERGGVISGTKDFRDAAVRAAKHGSRCGTGVGGAVRETEVNPDDAEVTRTTSHQIRVSSSNSVSSRIMLLLSMPETVVRWSLSRCDQRHNLCEREAVDFANEKGLNVSVLQDWLLFPILQAVILFGGIYCWWEDRGRRRSRKEGGTHTISTSE